VLAPANDGLFRKLLTLLGRDDLLSEDRFTTNASRIAHRAEIDALIADETANWDREALLAACAEAGVPAGPINDLETVLADPQVEARGMAIEADGVPGIRSPFRFSDAELALERPSPRQGNLDPD